MLSRSNAACAPPADGAHPRQARKAQQNTARCLRHAYGRGEGPRTAGRPVLATLIAAAEDAALRSHDLGQAHRAGVPGSAG